MCVIVRITTVTGAHFVIGSLSACFIMTLYTTILSRRTGRPLLPNFSLLDVTVLNFFYSNITVYPILCYFSLFDFLKCEFLNEMHIFVLGESCEILLYVDNQQL